jgi:putative hydrolase of the HAD superfamily
MNIKPIVLFDIDRTIFDTDKASVVRMNRILNILKTNDSERIEKVKENYRKTLKNEREYEPDGFVKILCEEFSFDNTNLLADVYYGENNKDIYKGSVYPEVIDVLDSLKKNNFHLGIFSEGTIKFQNHKFRSLDLEKYFDRGLIIIREAKDTDETIQEIPEGAIIVDDKEKICELLFKNGIKPIWLNKKNDRKSDKFVTIHNLLELKEKLM